MLAATMEGMIRVPLGATKSSVSLKGFCATCRARTGLKPASLVEAV